MVSYRFETKYERQACFEFKEDEMQIKEIWSDNYVTEYRFKYIDITRYSIVPCGGYYKIYFWANEKKIEEIHNGKKKFTTFFFINIKFEDDTNDVRKVIYNNTPLRSELDLIQEKSKKIYELYKNTSESEFGIIYLEGPRKEFNEYCIELNSIPFFTIYTSKQEKKLKDAGLYKESMAKPYWVDNKTIAFRIPYGNWNIGYSFEAIDPIYLFADYVGGGNNSYYTTGPKSIDVIVDMQHPEVRIRKKIGLLRDKLIEIT